VSKKHSSDVKIHNASDYVAMRKAGKLNAEVLDYIDGFVRSGVSTVELNDICHKMIIERGAIPAPLNYHGFPKSICTSVNHVVCHGIPGERMLQDGDIVNLDVTVIVDGYYGDSSRTFMIGESFAKQKSQTKRIEALVQTSYDSMMLGIDVVKPGKKLSDIGRAIQSYAESKGFSVVREYCGHGIGKVFHDSPSVLHYVPKNAEDMSYDMVLEEGMFFTIEPMINIGKFETILSRVDGWTVTTRDKSFSSQFEHTIAVTNNGYEIFTLSPMGLDMPKIKL
jgi:methionyl aminopeptidase